MEDEFLVLETTSENDQEQQQPIVINITNEKEEGELKLVAVDTNVTRISSSDTNGFKSIILAMIGDYDVITKDYTYQTYQGSTQHSVAHQEDYPWMISAAFFLVVLYCMLRMLGGAIFGKR